MSFTQGKKIRLPDQKTVARPPESASVDLRFIKCSATKQPDPEFPNYISEGQMSLTEQINVGGFFELQAAPSNLGIVLPEDGYYRVTANYMVECTQPADDLFFYFVNSGASSPQYTYGRAAPASTGGDSQQYHYAGGGSNIWDADAGDSAEFFTGYVYNGDIQEIGTYFIVEWLGPRQ